MTFIARVLISLLILSPLNPAAAQTISARAVRTVFTVPAVSGPGAGVQPVLTTPALSAPTAVPVLPLLAAPAASNKKAANGVPAAALAALKDGANALDEAKTAGAPQAALDDLFEGAPIRSRVVEPDVPELGRRKFADSYRFPQDGAVKVAFFDADKTLRVSLSGSVSANGPKDVMLLPWVSGTLAALARKGYLIVIVSNQAGVPKRVSLKDSDAALSYAVELIRREGGEAHYYDFAEKRNADRKPGVGMALRLERSLKEKYGPSARIDKWRSMMVGDSAYKKTDTRPDGKPGAHFSNADRLFAEAFKIPFHEPADFFGWRAHGIDVFLKAAQVEAFLKAHPRPAESRD